jgi:hypothetical protein
MNRILRGSSIFARLQNLCTISARPTDDPRCQAIYTQPSFNNNSILYRRFHKGAEIGGKWSCGAVLSAIHQSEQCPNLRPNISTLLSKFLRTMPMPVGWVLRAARRAWTRRAVHPAASIGHRGVAAGLSGGAAMRPAPRMDCQGCAGLMHRVWDHFGFPSRVPCLRSDPRS